MTVRTPRTTQMGPSSQGRRTTDSAASTGRINNGARPIAAWTPSTTGTGSSPAVRPLTGGDIVLPRTVVNPCIAHSAGRATARARSRRAASTWPGPHQGRKTAGETGVKLAAVRDGNLGFSFLDGTGEVDFVPEWNAEIPCAGNLRLSLPSAVHRARADGGDAEAAALVEAQGPDVVVGRGEHDLMAAEALGLGADRFDEHGADALVQVKRVDRGDLKRVLADLERDEAGDPAVALGDEARKGGRVENPFVHGNLRRTPELGCQPLDRGPVILFHWPNRHIPRIHNHHYPAFLNGLLTFGSL